MKKKKVTKRKKKKGENDEDEIKPTKHDNVGNLYSEEVAKEIFNKIFSNVFINLNTKKIDEIIDYYSVSNIICSVNNLIEILNLNHDMDISFPNPTNSKNKTFIDESKKEKIKKRNQDKKIYNKNNNINSETNDDDIINKRTYIDKITPEKLNDIGPLYSQKIYNTNFWGTIPQPKSFAFDRTSTYKNAIIISDIPEKKSKEINEVNVNDKKKKKFLRLKTRYAFSIKQVDNLYKIKKKPFIKANDDLPSEAISNEALGIVSEDEDIKKMRNDLMEEINQKIMEEKKQKEKLLLEEISKRKKFQKKSKKDNDNGLDPDSFIKEFISISSNQKEIKPGSTKAILEEERKQLTLKARKNIEYNRIPKVKSEKDRISDLRKKQKLFAKKYLFNSYNSNEDDDDESKGNSRPSGSNFDLIRPEIGVIIQENIKVKSGGINFYEKYNKFSVNDFNNTMNSIFVRNFSNTNYLGYNTYTTGKSNTSTTIKNKTDLLLRKNSKENDNIKIQINNGFNNDEDLNEKNLFRNTFKTKLENLKKKYIYKSKSKISMSNNINMDRFKEVLNTADADKSYYYYSHNLFHSNKSKNEFNNNFELSYIGKSKSINKNFFSPIPTNLINTYKNTLLKNYFYNAGDDYSLNQGMRTYRYNKYKIMDTFNKYLVEGNKEFNEKLYKNIFNKDEFLPKLRIGEASSTNHGTRTKNFFFRKRKNLNV